MYNNMTIAEIANEINTPSSLKYILCACIAGAANKMYDDIEDNFRLAQFKTAHNLETLKGIHYIAFTVLSIAYPLCFIILYFGIFINTLCTPSSYVLPYESSLVYSFAVLLLFLDYSKINGITNVEYCIMAVFILCISCEEAYDYISRCLNKNDTEVTLLVTDVSYAKLLERTVLIILIFAALKFGAPLNIKCFLVYIFIYFFTSCCTQFYSLYIYKPPQPNEVPPMIEEKKEEIQEKPAIKEDTDLFASTSEPTV